MKFNFNFQVNYSFRLISIFNLVWFSIYLNFQLGFVFDSFHLNFTFSFHWNFKLSVSKYFIFFNFFVLDFLTWCNLYLNFPSTYINFKSEIHFNRWCGDRWPGFWPVTQKFRGHRSPSGHQQPRCKNPCSRLGCWESNGKKKQFFFKFFFQVFNDESRVFSAIRLNINSRKKLNEEWKKQKCREMRTPELKFIPRSSIFFFSFSGNTFHDVTMSENFFGTRLVFKL